MSKTKKLLFLTNFLLSVFVTLSDCWVAVPEVVPKSVLGQWLGCGVVTIHCNSRVNSSTWCVKGAINLLICSLPLLVSKYGSRRLHLRHFPMDFLLRSLRYCCSHSFRVLYVCYTFCLFKVLCSVRNQAFKFRDLNLMMNLDVLGCLQKSIFEQVYNRCETIKFVVPVHASLAGQNWVISTMWSTLLFWRAQTSLLILHNLCWSLVDLRGRVTDGKT